MKIMSNKFVYFLGSSAEDFVDIKVSLCANYRGRGEVCQKVVNPTSNSFCRYGFENNNQHLLNSKPLFTLCSRIPILD